MSKFRKKPIVIDATQWFRNGDHPEDMVRVLKGGTESEGLIVRYYRHPEIEGVSRCANCQCWYFLSQGQIRSVTCRQREWNTTLWDR